LKACVTKLVPTIREGRTSLDARVKEKFTEKLRSDPREFLGRKVSEVVRTDGLKLVFDDGSWVCYRLSGTEPVCGCIRKRAMKWDSRN